ncbi:cytochrome c-type biogenesis protein CcmH [Cupriavidus agavae]|uniref:Cytochrome c-type biogenesis protein n=1 Tax=Cupriavidus agavae TaxID=1001822 RepID=A0A4Q7RRN6_9BURK|nr:cytochrome c-type biogenesis protein CcmH [Cupriavidus agavae]RZT36351.1 cytochrome c-type biogenesis protein CcmH [Cupriavidus agavae]
MRSLLAALGLAVAVSAHAAHAAPSDADLDARVHALAQQLRCVVCQNQTLADSNAELAIDLRAQIRAQLTQGASDQTIKDFMVQRYGEFVLYDPPFQASTWLLWLGPFGLLAGVVAWLWRRWARGRRSVRSPLPLAAPTVRSPNPSPACGRGQQTGSRWTTATLSVVLPPAAALLYLHLGNPAAVIQGDDAHSLSGDAHTPTIGQIESMVDGLARRLQANPDDAQGWAMLARSYAVMERFDDAAAAYGKAVALAPGVASLRSDYADVLASVNDGSLQGQALTQIRAALAADPDDPKGLALAASAAAQRGDTAEAVAHWEHLQRLLPADSQTAARIAANLAAARGK